MEDEAMMIAPGAGSGTGRAIRTHPLLDKHLFGSKARNFIKILKHLKTIILHCPETRQGILQIPYTTQTWTAPLYSRLQARQTNDNVRGMKMSKRRSPAAVFLSAMLLLSLLATVPGAAQDRAAPKAAVPAGASQSGRVAPFCQSATLGSPY